jgi:hypothetical protein
MPHDVPQHTLRVYATVPEAKAASDQQTDGGLQSRARFIDPGVPRFQLGIFKQVGAAQRHLQIRIYLQRCPLVGVKRKLPGPTPMSAYDP